MGKSGRSWVGGLGATVVLVAGAVACSATATPPSSTESVTTTASGLTVTGLFPTGVNAAGVVLLPGTVDTHYTLSSTGDTSTPPLGTTAVAVTANAAWTGNTLTSSWISIRTSTTGTTNATYTYTTTFSLTGVDPASATLSGTWAADDSVTLLLNSTQVATRAASAYGSVTAFSVPAGSPFQTGNNTLAFVTKNSGGGPTGLQVVTLVGSANGCKTDAQCPVGQWCNESASTCTAKLANGIAMPTDASHSNPTLNGKCTPLAATLVCISGVCDTKDDECGFATGDGPCTVLDGGTVCRSGDCSTTLVCEPTGGCDVDADCTGGDWCDETTNTCTPKLTNGTALPVDKPHDNPTLDGTCGNGVGALVCSSGVCDKKNSECGYANGDGPCTALDGGTVCQSGACSLGLVCEPVGGCEVDADCGAGKWCDISAATCTATLSNGTPLPTDTGHSNPTLNGTCNAGAGALVCASGVCDAKNSECGYANGDGPCTALTGPTVCQSGVCSLAGVCEPSGGCASDADCSGGKWCDVSTSTCTAKLSSGTPMPTDPGHTVPVLDGKCNPAAAALVCVSGVCDASDNECGFANGDGPCTGPTGPTVCRSGACSINLTCEPNGGCNVDGDCKAPTPVCDPATHGCTAATPDAGSEAGTVEEGGAGDGGSADGSTPDSGAPSKPDGGSGGDASVAAEAGGGDAGQVAVDSGQDASSNGYLEGGGLSCAVRGAGQGDADASATMAGMLAAMALLGLARGRARRGADTRR